ncbi:hypothetical protein T459_31707 [Capsicum annuum]|uniref:Uncharacterized protein n=1 Tax=Capsicum annuum TaxID=4072 RepID=A0A2G2Y3K9_CAPAN|nr:hypothetical protein T459_31707 [Capsicum annuum]
MAEDNVSCSMYVPVENSHLVPKRKRPKLGQPILSPVERIQRQLHNNLQAPDFEDISTGDETVTLIYARNQYIPPNKIGLGAIVPKRKRPKLGQPILSPVERIQRQLHNNLQAPDFEDISTGDGTVTLIYARNQYIPPNENGLGAMLFIPSHQLLQNARCRLFSMAEDNVSCSMYVPVENSHLHRAFCSSWWWYKEHCSKNNLISWNALMSEADLAEPMADMLFISSSRQAEEPPDQKPLLQLLAFGHHEPASSQKMPRAVLTSFLADIFDKSLTSPRNNYIYNKLGEADKDPPWNSDCVPKRKRSELGQPILSHVERIQRQLHNNLQAPDFEYISVGDETVTLIYARNQYIPPNEIGLGAMLFVQPPTTTESSMSVNSMAENNVSCSMYVSVENSHLITNNVLNQVAIQNETIGDKGGRANAREIRLVPHYMDTTSRVCQ